MHRLYGIETEYGIVVDGLTASDWIAESIAVVKGYAGKYATGWNYAGEDPRRDMRGFTVKNLSRNPDDAVFDNRKSHASKAEDERSDRVLTNGARLYNDHGHPEYATPECASVLSLVAHDKAGELVVQEAAANHSAKSGRLVTLYKNNTDYHGASYGTHEGYLMRRDVPCEALIHALLPFFASRQVYAGAGKCGVENDPSIDPNLFQLSQRADYFMVEASVDTLHNRPLVNTRDEPHATPSRFRRLHVICGDANMSETATALKVGATSLVLRLIEDGASPAITLENPVRAARKISRDVSLKATVPRANGDKITGLEIQLLYLLAAESRYAGESDEIDWILDLWKRTVYGLGEDPLSLADVLDWPAKLALFSEFRETQGIHWDDPYMQSLDLEYHNVDREAGLYYGLVSAAAMQTILSDAVVGAARTCPPTDTRAAIRGMFVERFASSVRSIGWNGVAFHHAGEDLVFDMNPLVENDVQPLCEELCSATSLDSLVASIRSSRAS